MMNESDVREHSVTVTECLISCIKASHGSCIGIQHSTDNCRRFSGIRTGAVKKDVNGEVYYVRNQLIYILDFLGAAAVKSPEAHTTDVYDSHMGEGGPCNQVLTGFRQYVDTGLSLSGAQLFSATSASLCKEKCLENPTQCEYFTYYKAGPQHFNDCQIHKYLPKPENGASSFRDPGYDTYGKC
ncbi:Uncharacterised protein g9365 [Pycnogonum litorale]